ncbi:DinB family protein [Deinococcus hohokamensis]|uniref:DinB family protein n=1 Tax=Deinococcus hohokamensis TaxID=309883 RepID=A0ABV9I8N3_9DEIO
MTELAAFLAEQYTLELAAFRAGLEAIPEPQFSAPAAGHSAAWHALHIAEWLRLAVLGDRSYGYGHLGWEDQAWAQALSTAPALREDAGRGAVLAALDAASAEVQTFLAGLSPDDLQGMSFSPSAPNGERPRLQALGLHLRHIAYHRGQLALLRRHLSGDSA